MLLSGHSNTSGLRPNNSFKSNPLRGSAVSGLMRPIAASICLTLAGCASQPRTAVVSDNCLAREPADWVSLANPPTGAPALKSLAKSTLANPPASVEERWYSSGENLLYCRREDWCVSETWEFTRRTGNWQLVDQHSWVCVTTHDNSFKPSPLRRSALFRR